MKRDTVRASAFAMPLTNRLSLPAPTANISSSSTGLILMRCAGSYPSRWK